MLLKGSLTGIKVLDLSRLLPGPYCTMILADHGARVIAIESRRFESEGLLQTVYRNKEHMTLDLKTEEGREIFYNMVKDADVVVEGFRPDAVKRLGVDYETLSRINTGIVYCSITGYGQTGPLRDRVGHDVNYMSFAGVLDLIGGRDGFPAIPGVQFADIAGGMNGAIGILLALFAREKNGKGQYIDISMTDCMASFLPIPFLMTEYAGQKLERSDSILSHRYACYTLYETADNRSISIGALENRFWKNLCEHFDAPEYIEQQFDEDRREDIIEFFKKQFAKKTLAEWEDELADLEICWAPVRNMDEVLTEPLFSEREMFVEPGNKKDGGHVEIGIPVKLSETPGQVLTAPVSFGENTEALLKEYGYSNKDIKKLKDKSVI